jgi:hypothetical protein
MVEYFLAAALSSCAYGLMAVIEKYEESLKTKHSHIDTRKNTKRKLT